MRRAIRLVVVCILTILTSKVGLAEASATLAPPPLPTARSLSNQGDSQPGIEIGYTTDPFERTDTRVIIPQLALALYHLCSLVEHNPCGHYILRGPWHNGIAFHPLNLLFGLPKQQPEFSWHWNAGELLTPSWLKGPKKYPDPMWRMAQLFPFTSQGNALALITPVQATLWPSVALMDGLTLFPKIENPVNDIPGPESPGTINLLRWKF